MSVLRAGLFLAMQYPSEISGVTNAEFLRSSINARREEGKEISLMKFIREMENKMEVLEMDPNMAHRYLNEGFSGGEKKRNEILQLYDCLSQKSLFWTKLTQVLILTH